MLRARLIALVLNLLTCVWLWYLPFVLSDMGLASDSKQFTTTTALCITLVSLVSVGIYSMPIVYLATSKPPRGLWILSAAISTITVLPILFLALSLFVLWFWNHH